MSNINKVVYLGTVKEWNLRSTAQVEAPVFCKIKYADDRLSISGVVGPMKNGNALGSCGQINSDELWKRITLADEWKPEMLGLFAEAWDKYHLNDMQSGSPAQMTHLESVKDQYPGYPVNYYDWACEELTKVGLYADPNYTRNGESYRYGTAWISIEVPVEVLDMLDSLPNSPVVPAWV